MQQAPGEDDARVQDYCSRLDEMRKSMASVREVVRSLQEKVNSDEFDTKDGISLLSVKSQLMLSYLQSLVLLSAHRVLGHPLTERSPPKEPFSSTSRAARGPGAGDRVDSMIEGRVVLEKIKILENKMRYQIEKLVRVAEESPETANNIVNDPLAFKPNPAALMNQEMSEEEEEVEREDNEQRDGIYRPPRLAPMLYTEPIRGKDKKRSGPAPAALSALTRLDPAMPHLESTSGLGNTPALASKRAQELQRMAEFEEENFTRLVMKKKDMKRRKQDEANIALGGIGVSGRHGRGGGLEDEFSDILRSVGRSRAGVAGDGYEELRQKGRKESVLARSRARTRDDIVDELADDGPRQRKKGRFEKEVKATKKRIAKSRR
ncbi:uncharacterized protein PHACADRAFT_256961 [Phanerochaete carnosa HHB-10118-sp]|uniref:Neuroguidin n=1 Tax=Phanerochaete carnosa (strain HHB-10118-sp) TaxID=650164 RepID=K5WAH2_PHACS|nr:uncharacterized protein PHACADRAFT_256961 [Phanerochaete carnosa HHB-10118-sp]EKM55969.1 hypothetical protein PHACADRAFT_256961 [Phanerochaete carnosa HHB-10118-sp]